MSSHIVQLIIELCNVATSDESVGNLFPLLQELCYYYVLSAGAQPQVSWHSVMVLGRGSIRRRAQVFHAAPPPEGPGLETGEASGGYRQRWEERKDWREVPRGKYKRLVAGMQAIFSFPKCPCQASRETIRPTLAFIIIRDLIRHKA